MWYPLIGCELKMYFLVRYIMYCTVHIFVKFVHGFDRVKYIASTTRALINQQSSHETIELIDYNQ